MKRVLARPLWMVLLLALALRIGALVALPGIFRFELTDQIHGSTAYDEYALNWLATGVYGREPGVPDAAIPPLYSIVLAELYATLGRGGWQVGLMHTAFDLLSIVLLYQIARRLFTRGHFFGRPAGEWVGLLGGLFMACYPYLIFQNLTLNDTALFMSLFYGFTLLLILLREREARDRVTWLLAIGAGLVLGITTLGRALLPPFALLAALWFLLRRPLGDTVLRLLPVAGISLLVLLPWTLRNYEIYGGFVAVALNTGENLYQGANDQTIPLFRAGYDVQWSEPPPETLGITDRYARNAALMQAGLDWLAANPQRIPELLWVKFLVHWSIDIAPLKNPLPGQRFALDEEGALLVLEDPDADKQDIEVIALYSGTLFDRVGRPVHIAYYGGLFLLALLGMALTWRDWRTVSLLWAAQFSMTFMYLLFHPSTRYRVPTDPLLFLFAAYALLWLAQRWRERGTLH